jgi:hypothetical protein
MISGVGLSNPKCSNMNFFTSFSLFVDARCPDVATLAPRIVGVIS